MSLNSSDFSWKFEDLERDQNRYCEILSKLKSDLNWTLNEVQSWETDNKNKTEEILSNLWIFAGEYNSIQNQIQWLLDVSNEEFQKNIDNCFVLIRKGTQLLANFIVENMERKRSWKQIKEKILYHLDKENRYKRDISKAEKRLKLISENIQYLKEIEENKKQQDADYEQNLAEKKQEEKIKNPTNKKEENEYYTLLRKYIGNLKEIDESTYK